jgi:type III secretion protein Q
MADRAVKKAKPKPVAAVSLRGRVPALSRSAVEALRGFFARKRHWLLRDGGVLRLDAANRGGGTPGGDTFALDADGTRLALRFAPGTDDAGSDGLRWNDHLGRSRVLAWSLAHEARLMRLSEALGVSLLPVADGSNEDAPGGGDGVWLDFTIDDYADDEAQTPSMRTRGALRVPAAWLARLAEHADATPVDETPVPGHWRRLPAMVSIAFTIPALSGRDWRSLRPGDAIVVGRSVRPPPLQAQAAGRAWPLAATSNGWRVEGAAQPLPPNPPSPPEKKMSNNDDNAATAVEDPARNLPVRVEFEIGQVELSLGELADLQPGYVFALPSQLEGANVVIRANGRASGRGEVVAVGDTLGVRLLSWS